MFCGSHLVIVAMVTIAIGGYWCKSALGTQHGPRYVVMILDLNMFPW